LFTNADIVFSSSSIITGLETALDSAKTLDDSIAAHNHYLRDIVRKSMARTHESNDMTHQVLSERLASVLATADEFCTLEEILFNQSLHAADVAAEKRVEAESRMSKGEWGFNAELEIAEQFFGLADPTVVEEIHRISETYNDQALELLTALNNKVNGNASDFIENDRNLDNAPMAAFEALDDDLDPQRFLIAQLDHNQYYASQGLIRQ
jgi:hypothetical protein